MKRASERVVERHLSRTTWPTTTASTPVLRSATVTRQSTEAGDVIRRWLERGDPVAELEVPGRVDRVAERRAVVACPEDEVGAACMRSSRQYSSLRAVLLW